MAFHSALLVVQVALALALVAGKTSCVPNTSPKSSPDARQLASGKSVNKQLQTCQKMLEAAAKAVETSVSVPDCGSLGIKRGDPCMVALADIVPTQASVGFEQVELRGLKIRRHIEQRTLLGYLEQNPEPIVVGPNRRLHIIDHHHLGAALYKEGVQRTFGVIIEDLSHLAENDFWQVMSHCQWVYPKDEKGQSIGYHELPKDLAGLKDNPYRSLAGFVRKSNGFAKIPEPFIEFRWAEFFQEHLNLKPEEIQANYEQAIQAALELAHSPLAEKANLPGYTASSAEAQKMSKELLSAPPSLMRCQAATDAAAKNR
jgi:hypothetical protein